MLVVRSVTLHDIDAVYELIKKSNGMLTSLPLDKKIITLKIQHAVKCFKKNISTPLDELYFFVLEDTATKQLVGCCAILSAVGVTEPTYSYHIAKLKCISQQLQYQHTMHILELNNDFDGASELCSLYLLPAYRKNAVGKLLSLARFLFIANAPQRFSSLLFAEIRGHIHNDGQPPFWEHVAGKFFPVDFAKADKLTGMNKKQFIADLMPTFPLYVELLHEKAQQVIGKPNPAAEPAMQMLINEGFHYRDYIDIFDAGPMLESFTSSVKTIQENNLLTITDIADHQQTELCIIAATGENFRAILTTINKIDANTAILDSASAAVLRITIGDKVRCRFLNN